MKVIFILFLCFLVNLVSAQDFQYRIDSNVNTCLLYTSDAADEL